MRGIKSASPHCHHLVEQLIQRANGKTGNGKK